MHHRTTTITGMLAVAAVAGCAAPRSASTTQALTTTLRAQTQALLDAVTAGDAAVWQRTLADDASYVAEDGTRKTKAGLVAEVTPLPAGISGALAITAFDVRRYGDVAVTVYDADERETYFGQELTARYRMTDVWHRTGAAWRLVATQVHVVLFDPPAVALPPDQLDDYVGSYRLTEAITYEIRRDGAALVGQRSGRDPQALSVELRDVMFVAGQPRSRKIFARGGDGRITGFVDRREGHDVRWERRP